MYWKNDHCCQNLELSTSNIQMDLCNAIGLNGGVVDVLSPVKLLAYLNLPQDFGLQSRTYLECRHFFLDSTFSSLEPPLFLTEIECLSYVSFAVCFVLPLCFILLGCLAYKKEKHFGLSDSICRHVCRSM